ncbi:hypothetical protein M569_08949, partial [Genlisea aurea]
MGCVGSKPTKSEQKNDFQDEREEDPKAAAAALDSSPAFGCIDFGSFIEVDHVVSGWPPWLAAAAGDAIEGWLPLRSDSYQRLEK